MNSFTIEVLTLPVYKGTTVLDFFGVIIILMVALILAHFAGREIRAILLETVSKANIDLIIKIVQYCIYLIAILLILPRLNLDLSGLFVAGGIVAVAVAFATQNIISNLISGLFLIFERPIKVGDTVLIDNQSGIVQDIQIMSTIIRGYDGKYNRIPNSKLFTSDITNLMINPAVRFKCTVGIRYRDDAEKAIQIIEELIDKEPYALKNPAPMLYVDKLDTSSVNIIVRTWAPPSQWWDLRMKLLWKIKVALEQNGIQIPFPQSEIWFRNTLNTEEILPDVGDK